MKIKFLITIIFMGTFWVSHSQEYENSSFYHKKSQDQVPVKSTENSPTDGRISLRLSGNSSFVTILLGFIPEGTVNFDDGYDGLFINNGQAIEFYSFLGSTQLSIQALPELTNVNVQVPLGYELTSDGSYTISIDAEFLSPDFDIILEDRDQNVFTDLRQTGYTFSGTTGEEHDRFFLNLDYLNALEINHSEKKSNKVIAYFFADRLKIQTKRNDIKTVQMFSITGRQVFSSNFANEMTIKNLKKGVYIIQYTTVTGAKMIKKIIK
ncbi:T9SS type A sorting domain-containing protein [Kordia sp.]|uniref:T9SS type A sorting domain-containing protein n=1 Tax=Kordia sp. TaxID=1965332 RepID=UPI0025BAD652|nr:T9SS type A sorting domain-containing protein [Kordia sp.]MCH2194083.1 T9SS type A sorting domain-containing protein [Kordia sp.]